MQKDHEPCGCCGSKSLRELRLLVEMLERREKPATKQEAGAPDGGTRKD